MMNFLEEKAKFEKTFKGYDRKKLKFYGVDGFDVYNPSIPFIWDKKKYLFGRVEKREKWAESETRLFVYKEKNKWTLVKEFKPLPLEDPFISFIEDEIVLGGVFVEKNEDEIVNFTTRFYRGKDLNSLIFFAEGPAKMKDIRLVGLANKKIGVFSRPKDEKIKEKYGCEAIVGFSLINDLSKLNSEIISQARYIPGLFKKDEWGGCNQAYCLGNNKIGVIGHKSYYDSKRKKAVYTVISFVFDIEKHSLSDLKTIGTRASFPQGPAKKEFLTDCAFPAGIVGLRNSRVSLYSGINDCEVGCILIDNPF